MTIGLLLCVGLVVLLTRPVTANGICAELKAKETFLKCSPATAEEAQGLSSAAWGTTYAPTKCFIGVYPDEKAYKEERESLSLHTCEHRAFGEMMAQAVYGGKLGIVPEEHRPKYDGPCGALVKNDKTRMLVYCAGPLSSRDNKLIEAAIQ